jgi:hypothetical protein
MPNENIVRPAISSVMRCMISRRSMSSPMRASSLAMVSSSTAVMCGTRFAVARGVKAGARVRRWNVQECPSAIRSPSPSTGRSMRMPAGVRV